MSLQRGTGTCALASTPRKATLTSAEQGKSITESQQGSLLMSSGTAACILKTQGSPERLGDRPPSLWIGAEG